MLASHRVDANVSIRMIVLALIDSTLSVSVCEPAWLTFYLRYNLVLNTNILHLNMIIGQARFWMFF